MYTCNGKKRNACDLVTALGLVPVHGQPPLLKDVLPTERRVRGGSREDLALLQRLVHVLWQEDLRPLP